MIDFPVKIPLQDLENQSRLFSDYVSGTERPIHTVLGQYLQDAPVWKERLKAQASFSGAGGGKRRDMLEHLVDYNIRLGAGDDLVGKLAAAGDGKAGFVVTGQQPGVLGGPLLTMHKITTAIVLAEKVEKNHGLPCVPLFWMGADDIDFREIRELFLLASDLSPLLSGFGDQAHEAAQPVGDIPAEAVKDVFDSVEPFVDLFPHGRWAKDVVLGAIGTGSDHGEVTARLISKLTRGRVAVVDGRDKAVRLLAKNLFCNYFDGEAEFKAEVADRGRVLERMGYHSQLSLGPDSGVFFMDGGRRLKITDEGRKAARTRMEGGIEDFAPGVVLRNLVQDYVFEPVAVVLGPAEIAYRAQIAGVYEKMSVPMPVVFPRMLAAYIPPALGQFLQNLQAPDVFSLLLRPSSFVQSVYDQAAGGEIEKAASDLRKSFESSVEKFLAAAARHAENAAVGKLKKRLAEVERRLERALSSAGESGKAAALSRWPFLAHTGDVVRRSEKPQERQLSLLAPFLFGGEEAISSVTGAAFSFVTEALDGKTFFIVYST